MVCQMAKHFISSLHNEMFCVFWLTIFIFRMLCNLLIQHNIFYGLAKVVESRRKS